MPNSAIQSGRRLFLQQSAAIGGVLLLGFDLGADAQATTQDGVTQPEVTHWIVIQPDDTVIIRIARSEMGQGTFTGLSQLIAEELECDWNHVRPEYADVNMHVRRKRIFKDMSTGGSRGIRDSQDYIRKAGAAAREMLVAAAAAVAPRARGRWGARTSARSCSFLKPGNAMLVPLMYFFGFSR